MAGSRVRILLRDGRDDDAAPFRASVKPGASAASICARVGKKWPALAGADMILDAAGNAVASAAEMIAGGSAGSEAAPAVYQLVWWGGGHSAGGGVDFLSDAGHLVSSTAEEDEDGGEGEGADAYSLLLALARGERFPPAEGAAGCGGRAFWDALVRSGDEDPGEKKVRTTKDPAGACCCCSGRGESSGAPVVARPSLSTAEMGRSIETLGFFVAPPEGGKDAQIKDKKELDWDEPEAQQKELQQKLGRLRAAVRALQAAGWPPVFAFVYDEAWWLLRRAVKQCAAVLGEDCVLEPSLYAYSLRRPAEHKVIMMLVLLLLVLLLLLLLTLQSTRRGTRRTISVCLTATTRAARLAFLTAQRRSSMCGCPCC